MSDDVVVAWYNLERERVVGSWDCDPFVSRDDVRRMVLDMRLELEVALRVPPMYSERDGPERIDGAENARKLHVASLMGDFDRLFEVFLPREAKEAIEKKVSKAMSEMHLVG